MQSREAAAAGMSFEDTIGGVAEDVLSRLPPNFDIEAVEASYPQEYYNSMNTVLAQVGATGVDKRAWQCPHRGLGC